MRTKDSYTHPMLEIAASRYSMSSGQLRYLGGSQNMVSVFSAITTGMNSSAA
ncbi:hypothetical protein NYE80_04685 [Paenibacillus sp. FSL H7-0357]|jgi:hypothetical protein|uniref:hypothetical protein n=1 Tax=Paenibacillus sp. FSL H7-0357 TaxID=1536774 RepID=UPI000A6A909E|nr:hypothetical protein [Paenibacillus sp. FSL H7-0357]